MNIPRTGIFLAFLLASGITGAQGDGVIEDGEFVHGKSRAGYANDWWQWAVSMSDGDSALRDTTGALCGTNQEGPVWYLAGGFGTSRISRTCRMPAGRHVFFPVINMLYFPNGEDAHPSCESVKESAAVNNRYLRSFKVTVDGHEFVNPAFFRVTPEACFDLIARKPKEYTPRTVYPSATDGYWVMLRPLAPGTHHIAFHAEYHRPGGSYGTMRQDIEYTLEVFEAGPAGS